MEHVECQHRLIQRTHAVQHAAGDAQMSPGPSRRVTPPIVNSTRPSSRIPICSCGCECSGTTESGLEADNREHQVLAGGREDLDARKDHVLRA